MKKILLAIGVLAIVLIGAYLTTPKQKRLGDDYRLADQQHEDPVLPVLPEKKLESAINLYYFSADDQKCERALAVPAPDLDRRVKFQEITAINALLTQAVPEGYKSAMIPGTGVEDFRIVSGAATLDLGSFLTIGKGNCTFEARRSQVLKTLSQFGSLKEIILLSEGQPVD